MYYNTNSLKMQVLFAFFHVYSPILSNEFHRIFIGCAKKESPRPPPKRKNTAQPNGVFLDTV